jgi:hypothetical protein
VLGVQWDPYSGDHLQVYKYEADTGQWLYNEMPVHQPFYDREWIGVVPGPVAVNGQTHEYVSFIKGGYPTKEAWYYSTDGFNYHTVTSKLAEQMLGGARTSTHLAITESLVGQPTPGLRRIRQHPPSRGSSTGSCRVDRDHRARAAEPLAHGDQNHLAGRPDRRSSGGLPARRQRASRTRRQRRLRRRGAHHGATGCTAFSPHRW